MGKRLDPQIAYWAEDYDRGSLPRSIQLWPAKFCLRSKLSMAKVHSQYNFVVDFQAGKKKTMAEKSNPACCDCIRICWGGWSPSRSLAVMETWLGNKISLLFSVKTYVLIAKIAWEGSHLILQVKKSKAPLQILIGAEGLCGICTLTFKIPKSLLWKMPLLPTNSV